MRTTESRTAADDRRASRWGQVRSCEIFHKQPDRARWNNPSEVSPAADLPMTGVAAARALEGSFDAIVRAELDRLSKKVAHLDAPHRAVVEAVARQVGQAIASRPVRALREHDEPRLVKALVALFGVSIDDRIRDRGSPALRPVADATL